MFKFELKRLISRANSEERRALILWRERHPFASVEATAAALWQIQQCILLAQQQKRPTELIVGQSFQ